MFNPLNLISKFIRSGNQKELDRLKKITQQINSLEEEIRGITCPTLIINGDEDDMCLEVGLYLKRTIKTAGLLIVPKTGHTINLEEPDLFNSNKEVSSSEDMIGSKEDIEEEDDIEIPAFLRRQKN